jgi:hypothetical protein
VSVIPYCTDPSRTHLTASAGLRSILSEHSTSVSVFFVLFDFTVNPVESSSLLINSS